MIRIDPKAGFPPPLPANNSFWPTKTPPLNIQKALATALATLYWCSMSCGLRHFLSAMVFSSSGACLCISVRRGQEVQLYCFLSFPLLGDSDIYRPYEGLKLFYLSLFRHWHNISEYEGKEVKIQGHVARSNRSRRPKYKQ